MTTLPFERKNNLLSLLRGYDLPIKHNYLNSALLGFGKHHHHHHHHHHHKEKETTYDKTNEKYKNFRSTVENALRKYFTYFSENLSDHSFWYGKDFYDALCAFTRYFVASNTERSTEFLSNIENFLAGIVTSERYDSLADKMYDLAKKYKKTDELPEEYTSIKTACGNDIREISEQCLSQDVLSLDEQTIINLILDCIVYSTQDPEGFAWNFEEYQKKVTKSYDSDALRLFSEDLQDTAYDDEKESEGEYDSEDERFVVPDGEEYIEYEDEEEEEKPTKRRKIVYSDDEEEVNGSGFYDWWW
jgi:hypothetical protein